jgi:hypothetical protein
VLAVRGNVRDVRTALMDPNDKSTEYVDCIEEAFAQPITSKAHVS